MLTARVARRPAWPGVEGLIQMRILLVGAGGVGSAVVPIAARRGFFEQMLVADYDVERAERAVAQVPGDARFSAVAVDASNAENIAHLVKEHRITHVLNARTRPTRTASAG
jgi:saccharopine dehydrogenase (NAD+, L-lysine forming)